MPETESRAPRVIRAYVWPGLTGRAHGKPGVLTIILGMTLAALAMALLIKLAVETFFAA